MGGRHSRHPNVFAKAQKISCFFTHNMTTFITGALREKIITLHVEHHAVCDPFSPVRHDARELLLVGLAARHNHVAAAHRHRPVRVARLLESGLALQLGVPFDHASGLPVGRHASCDGHLVFRGLGNNCGRRQSHACRGPNCREENN